MNNSISFIFYFGKESSLPFERDRELCVLLLRFLSIQAVVFVLCDSLEADA
jgi:hypothetical protein